MSDNTKEPDPLTYTVLADIRAILGVGMAPMLEELPALVRDIKAKADAAPAPLSLTPRQISALRQMALAAMSDIPDEERLGECADDLKAAFPAAYNGGWWEEVPA